MSNEKAQLKKVGANGAGRTAGYKKGREATQRQAEGERKRENRTASRTRKGIKIHYR